MKGKMGAERKKMHQITEMLGKEKCIPNFNLVSQLCPPRKIVDMQMKRP